MLAQNWRMRATLRRRLDTRAGRSAAIVAAYTCAVYALAIVISLSTGDTSPVGAPWLGKDQDAGAFFVSFLFLLGLGAETAMLHYLVNQWRKRRSLRPPKRREWTPTDNRVAAHLALKWMFTGWRLCVSGLSVVLAVGSLAVVLLNPVMRGQLWEKLTGGAWVNSIGVSLLMLWALLLKGRELRRGKERIKVADEYLAIREERLYHEYSAMCEKFLQQQQDWKAEKMAEMYAQIMDQQARGKLPCPNCEGHRKSA